MKNNPDKEIEKHDHKLTRKKEVKTLKNNSSFIAKTLEEYEEIGYDDDWRAIKRSFRRNSRHNLFEDNILKRRTNFNAYNTVKPLLKYEI